MNNERTNLVIIIAVFALVYLIINNAFVLLTPLPESPEMQRAKAEIAIKQAEADIQNQKIYQTYLVAIGVIVAGLLLCFGSLWLAFRVIKVVAAGITPHVLPAPHESVNPYAIEVMKNEHKTR